MMRVPTAGILALLATCACAHQRTPRCPTVVVLPRSFDIGPTILALDARLDTSDVQTTEADSRPANPHLRYRRILGTLAGDLDSVSVGLDDSSRVRSIHLQFGPGVNYADLVERYTARYGPHPSGHISDPERGGMVMTAEWVDRATVFWVSEHQPPSGRAMVSIGLTSHHGFCH